jgi:hypothetical protein
MDSPNKDRRAHSRVTASVPASIRRDNAVLTHNAVTRDLSMSGVFLYADEPIAQGTKLEIILILPEELGLGPKQWACCQASVVRIEERDGNRFGVAASLERLDVLPEIPD